MFAAVIVGVVIALVVAVMVVLDVVVVASVVSVVVLAGVEIARPYSVYRMLEISLKVVHYRLPQEH